MGIVEDFKLDFDAFVAYSCTFESPGLYKPQLAKMLLAIKEEKYQEARTLAVDEMANHRYGNLRNKGKDIYEYVVDYCNERIVVT